MLWWQRWQTCRFRNACIWVWHFLQLFKPFSYPCNPPMYHYYKTLMYNYVRKGAEKARWLTLRQILSCLPCLLPYAQYWLWVIFPVSWMWSWTWSSCDGWYLPWYTMPVYATAMSCSIIKQASICQENLSIENFQNLQSQLFSPTLVHECERVHASLHRYCKTQERFQENVFAITFSPHPQ